MKRVAIFSAIPKRASNLLYEFIYNRLQRDEERLTSIFEDYNAYKRIGVTKKGYDTTRTSTNVHSAILLKDANDVLIQKYLSRKSSTNAR